VTELRTRADRALLGGLRTAQDGLTHTSARLAALGPAATLARGYAVVQRIDTATNGPAPVLRSVADAPEGTELRIRLCDGAVGAVVTSGR
jgi:exodeoxyribonuclease VII large subunit